MTAAKLLAEDEAKLTKLEQPSLIHDIGHEANLATARSLMKITTAVVKELEYHRTLLKASPDAVTVEFDL